MLRLVVALLVAANLAFFAWTQGWLDDVVGVRAAGDREPERLRNQIRPELVRVLPTPVAATAVADAACLEAGPFAPAALPAAEAALRALVPAGGWTVLRLEQPGTWLVYMGAYPDRETLLRKTREIRRTRVEYEEVALPGEGEFGLALGRHDDRDSAERALLAVQQRGIRSARVVQLTPAADSHLLRFERAASALAAVLTSARNDALGAGFVPCGRPEVRR